MATNNPSMSVAESNKGLFLARATGPAQVIKGPLLFMVISWLPWEWWLGGGYGKSLTISLAKGNHKAISKFKIGRGKQNYFSECLKSV